MTAPLPSHQPSAKSPFKFLDAYTARDKDRFFGRDLEEKRLVELIFRSRLLLVYGQSGTGKSSLVQCGLAKSMSDADYFPIIIRRRTNLLTSLQTELNSRLNEKETEPSELLNQITRLSRYLMRPIYLIFDQFEEIFISGDHSEQTQFLNLLKTLYESSGVLKLLLVMREEYIAYLYPYEDLLPNLFDFRLRVEPMSEKNLRAVIIGTCQKVNIPIIDPEQTITSIIANNQSPKNPFQLPYLQVYLDRLWRKRPDQDTSAVVFNPALVGQVGKIEDVLAQFVDEQQADIRSKLSDNEQPAVKKILEELVTFEGTRRQCTVATIASETGYSPALISQIGGALADARIVQFDDGNYELAHDSLAKVIDNGRSTEQRQINSILKRLKEDYQDYIDHDKTVDQLLEKRLLAQIDLYEGPIEDELKRSAPNGPDISLFIDRSRRFLESQQQAELQKQKDDLARQQQQNKRLMYLVAGVSVLLAGAVTLGWYALKLQEKAQEQAQNAQAALNLVILQRAKEAYSKKERYDEYEEPKLAIGASKEAQSILNSLSTAPRFPKNEEKQANKDLNRLKKNLATLKQDKQ